MFKSAYDPDEDNVIAVPQTEAVKFVEREDADAYDFLESDLTMDADWHDLDLSAVVPEGAVMIILHVRYQRSVAVGRLEFIGKTGASTWTSQRLYINEANNMHSQAVFLPCDSTRVIRYTTNNATLTYIWGVVAGWFI